jgi:glycyl-tRNA synthetase beta chain
VLTQQPDITLVSTGPSEKVAFKDGQPTPSAEAFAKRLGITVKDIEITDTPKGRYITANTTKIGRPAVEVIAEELPKELAGIYWAKNMVWLSPTGQNASGGDPRRTGRPERFVRPVRWLLALLGEMVVPVEFGGKTAGRTTRGHRVLAGDEAIPIGFPDEYAQTLLDAHVIADVEARRLVIRKALDKATRTAGATNGDSDLRWREDCALVDTVTHLTEWPTVVLGSFEPEYLALPEEVLVTVMRDHQKYFAVEEQETGNREQETGNREQGTGNREQKGKLAPYFLAVLNTKADAAGEEVIRHGNERVLRARFNDARFFWEFDQRVPLVERVARLEKVTFQKDLGSYAAKTERVSAVAASLAGVMKARGSKLDGAALDTAARLAKTDLTTELVKEFTELQGQVGGLYARAQGFSAAVGDAIYDQYLPKSMEDAVPRTVEGALLAIADKVDTIVGMFGLGLEPTGSKDPFALRRAANGIVKILAEAEPALPLTLGDVVDAASVSEKVRLSVMKFFAERVEFYLRDVRGNAYDTVAAVMNAHIANPNSPLGMSGYDDIADTVERAAAVTRIRGSADFKAVCAAYKRLKNIYAQALERKDMMTHFIPDFATQVEAELWKEVESAGAGYLTDCRYKRYDDALDKLAKMRPIIDRYFEAVMVMVEDLKVRANRLGMVRYLVITFAQIADFSEIVTQG